MASLRDVQALNALAADHLQQQELNLKEASVALSHAISKLSWCVLEEEEDQAASSSSGNVAQHSSTSSSSVLQVYASASPEECSALNKMQNKEIFPHTFRFHFLIAANTNTVAAPSLEPIPNSSQHHTGCAIVCLFNLGLCFHLEYLRHKQEYQQQQSRLLRKALRCYEQAYSVATTVLAQLQSEEQDHQQVHFKQEQQQEQTSTASSTTRLLPPLASLQSPSALQVLMAACTNATMACTELARTNAAQEWNHRLQHLVAHQSVADCPFLHFFTVHAILYGFDRPTAQAA